MRKSIAVWNTSMILDCATNSFHYCFATEDDSINQQYSRYFSVRFYFNIFQSDRKS